MIALGNNVTRTWQNRTNLKPNLSIEFANDDGYWWFSVGLHAPSRRLWRFRQGDGESCCANRGQVRWGWGPRHSSQACPVWHLRTETKRTGLSCANTLDEATDSDNSWSSDSWIPHCHKFNLCIWHSHIKEKSKALLLEQVRRKRVARDYQLVARFYRENPIVQIGFGAKISPQKISNQVKAVKKGDGPKKELNEALKHFNQFMTAQEFHQVPSNPKTPPFFGPLNPPPRFLSPYFPYLCVSLAAMGPSLEQP